MYDFDLPKALRREYRLRYPPQCVQPMSRARHEDRSYLSLKKKHHTDDQVLHLRVFFEVSRSIEEGWVSQVKVGGDVGCLKLHLPRRTSL